MNNKAIIEFGFRGRILRILQISEGAIHLGLRPLLITPSLICRLLHILLSLYSIIAKYLTVDRVHLFLFLNVDVFASILQTSRRVNFFMKVRKTFLLT